MFDTIQKKIMDVTGGNKIILIGLGLLGIVILGLLFVILDAVLKVVDNLYYDIYLHYFVNYLSIFMVITIFYGLNHIKGKGQKLKPLMMVLVVIASYIATMFIVPRLYKDDTLGILKLIFWWIIRFGLMAGFIFAAYYLKSFYVVFAYLTLRLLLTSGLAGIIIKYDTWLIIRIAIYALIFIGVVKFVKSEQGFFITMSALVGNFLYGLTVIFDLSALRPFKYAYNPNFFESNAFLFNYLIYFIIGLALVFYLSHATDHLKPVKEALLSEGV